MDSGSRNPIRSVLMRTPCAPAGRGGWRDMGHSSQALKRDLLKSRGHRVQENQFPIMLKPKLTQTDQLGVRPHRGDGGSYSRAQPCILPRGPWSGPSPPAHQTSGLDDSWSPRSRAPMLHLACDGRPALWGEAHGVTRGFCCPQTQPPAVGSQAQQGLATCKDGSVTSGHI